MGFNGGNVLYVGYVQSRTMWVYVIQTIRIYISGWERCPFVRTLSVVQKF